jgi:hypothetical protein
MLYQMFLQRGLALSVRIGADRAAMQDRSL